MNSPTLLVVESSPPSPPKFDAAFLDRRMREHREWQEQLAREAAAEIIAEVAAGVIEYARQRAAYGSRKIARVGA
jgi:hypothetical protein